MSDLLGKRENCHGSEIEVFNSGKAGKYAFVFNCRNGDQFASKEDLGEDQVRELLSLFDRSEVEMLKRFNPDKYEETNIEWPTIMLCGFFYLSSLYLSGFDWRLAIMMLIPIVIILRKSNKKGRNAR
jgi:hypothetical protein